MKSLPLAYARACISLVLFVSFGLGPLAWAQDQTVNGNLSVTGDADIGGNTLSVGTRTDSSTTPGLNLLYGDGSSPTIYFNATRPAASWLWQSNTSTPQLQLSNVNVLSLFNPNTGIAGVVLDPAGAASFSGGVVSGQGGAAVRSWTVPVTADGPIALTNGNNRWNGIYVLGWEGPNRSHNIVFAATGQQYEGANITILSERAYNGAPVLTDLRIMQSADGTTQQLVVTVLNRNGGTGNATISYYGSEPNVNGPGGGVLFPNRVSVVNNLAGSGPISTGNVGIGDTVAALSPLWKGVEVVGQSGYDKVVVGPLASTYTGATIGAHASALNAWADLNIAGNNLIFRTNGEVETARLTSSGNLGIGTTAPVSRLTLAGGGNSNPNVGAEVDYGGQNLTFQGINNGGTYTLGGIKMVQPTGYYVDHADMVFSTNKGGVFSEDMRVKGGNVGIGTTTPAGLLSVQSTTAGNPTVFITKADSGSPHENGGALTFENLQSHDLSRNAGVIGGSINFNYSQPTSGVSQLGAQIQAISDYTQSSTDTPAALVFGTFNSPYYSGGGAHGFGERMRISSNGNVGIGTTTPAAKLDVAGDAQVRGKLHIAPSGDLTMGSFTAGTNPAQ